MCLFNTGPDPAPPELPPEHAQQRLPDTAAVRTAAQRRTEDRVRSGQRTILTSGSGVKAKAPTAAPVLLGS